MIFHIGNTNVELRCADICTLEADAIVNPANDYLWMGSGVSAKLKIAGGEDIEKEALAKGPVLIGEAVLTGAGKLPASYIIHSVVMGQDLKTDEDTVYRATVRALGMAEEMCLSSLAIPPICLGLSHFSTSLCAKAMIKAVIDFLIEGREIDGIFIVLERESVFQIFSDEMKNRFTFHREGVRKKKSKR